jgi:hypothetical protein
MARSSLIRLAPVAASVAAAEAVLVHLGRTYGSTEAERAMRVFHLTPIDEGRGTRYLFRSRWTTAPWWLTAGGWLGIVPADFVMSRDHLHGVRERAEGLARATQPSQAS